MGYLAPAVNMLTKEQVDFIEYKVKDKDIIFMSIHGSHLYGLSREGSDLDIKAIYAPTKSDLLLGDSVKTFNHKNDKLDIEIEVKSLSSFLKSSKSCDTNCIDLLHTPNTLVLQTSALWDELCNYRHCLFSKNMKGLVGYIKTHSKKYTNKIDRFDEMVFLKGLSESLLLNGYKTVEDVAVDCSELEDKKCKYIKPVSVVSDHEQKYLEVCGKKYIYTWSLEQLISAMDVEIKRYGKRTLDGSGKGMDTKSLSHALRVLCQLEEILVTDTIVFPLAEASYLLEVKLGKRPLPDILDDIDCRYERCMGLLSESDLPENSSIDNMVNVAERYIFNE